MQPYEMKPADVMAAGGTGGVGDGGGVAFTISSAPDSPGIACYDLRFTPGTHAHTCWVLVHFVGGFYR